MSDSCLVLRDVEPSLRQRLRVFLELKYPGGCCFDPATIKRDLQLVLLGVSVFLDVDFLGGGTYHLPLTSYHLSLTTCFLPPTAYHRLLCTTYYLPPATIC